MNLLTLDEAAKRLGVSRRTVDRLISEGRLRATRIRVRPYLSTDEIEQYVASAAKRRSA